MLFDTDVLIWLFRGRTSARQFLEGASRVELSVVTYMELAQGVRNKGELRLLRRTVGMNGWGILPVSEAIGQRATTYIEDHAFARGMRLADALIAATAVERGRTLATANRRHYEFVPGITLERYRP